MNGVTVIAGCRTYLFPFTRFYRDYRDDFTVITSLDTALSVATISPTPFLTPSVCYIISMHIISLLLHNFTIILSFKPLLYSTCRCTEGQVGIYWG
jgi:hypothetical protein